MEPEVTNKKICRDIMTKLRDTFGESECGGKQGAYDGGKSLFTSGSLSFNSKEFPVFLDDRKTPSFRPGDRGGKFGDDPSTRSPGRKRYLHLLSCVRSSVVDRRALDVNYSSL